MSEDFDINCLLDDPLSPTLVHKVLYVLVANGARYNAGKYPGKYTIFVDNGENTSEREEDSGEMIERLPEIVDKYSSKDLTNDRLHVQLSDYTLAIRPYNDRQSVVSFLTSTADVSGEQEFLQLTTTVEDLCRRLDITYVEYQSEYDHAQYPSVDDLSADHLRTVTYFENDLVDEIGREQLLSLPAYDIRVHDDGGVFIVVSPDPKGGYEEVEAARDQLKE